MVSGLSGLSGLRGITQFAAPVDITPPPVAGYTVWLTDRDTSTLSLNGSNELLQWNDRSGNNNHGTTNASNTRPNYGTHFGRTAIRCCPTAVDTQFSTIDGTFINTTNGFTAYAVIAHTSVSWNGSRVVCASTALTDAAQSAATRAVPFSRLINSNRLVRAGAVIATSSTLGFDTYAVCAGVFDGTAGIGTARVNGGNQTGSTSGNFNASVYRVGTNTQSSPSAGDTWSGAIKELILFPFALSAAQLTAMDSYLATAHSITF